MQQENTQKTRIISENNGKNAHKHIKGAMRLIKGLSRQVIVVQPQDSEWIEQAVLFVRVSASRKGLDEDALMAEAGRIIGEKIKPPKRKGGLLWSRKKKR